MIAVAVAQCVYIAIGGLLTPLIVAALFAPERAWRSLSAPVPAFIIVVAVLLLWPMLVLLVVTQQA